MTDQWHLFLSNRQRFASGHPNLPFHQIQARDVFGHRVLDLQAGIHLHEEKLAARVQQEFHRACALVADGLCGLDRRFTHGLAQFGCQAGRRCFFDDLLMSALNGAVALIEVETVTMAVGKHLNLDVARSEDVFLHQHSRVAER